MKKRLQIIIFNTFDFDGRGTTALIGGLIILFLVILGIWFEIKPNLKEPPIILEPIVIAFSFFISGLAGLIGAIRREFPQFIIIKGKPAIVIGWMVACISWSISIYSIIKIIGILL